jgi:hypothetical protein
MAPHSLLQIPVNLGVGLGRKSSRRFDNTTDSHCRWRRDTWFANAMGEERSRFTAREQLRC